ncbi:MAG: hypothetical protein HQK51_18930, partial [Oligoflexia bacterium]|nr:hypothetical protein [Oligoflexia bacterium]
MRYFKIFLLAICSFYLFVCNIQQSKAEVDARAKIVLSMATYGTVGGALLGLASMAYGTKFRAVAVG